MLRGFPVAETHVIPLDSGTRSSLSNIHNVADSVTRVSLVEDQVADQDSARRGRNDG